MKGLCGCAGLPDMSKSQWVDFDKAMAELEGELEGVIRGISVHAFNSLLSKTPQFYGRMTASWDYQIGSSPSFYDRSEEVMTRFQADREDFDSPDQFSGFWRGHPAAIAIANNHSRGREAGFKLGNTIWITNGVDHGEGPYSDAIEQGEVRLRAENYPDPSSPVKRTVEQMVKNFSGAARSNNVTFVEWRWRLMNAKIGGKRV